MYDRNGVRKRMDTGRAKIARALKHGDGHTILSTGITGDDARLARAVCEVGVSVIESKFPEAL